MENPTIDQIPHNQVYYAVTAHLRDQSTRWRSTHDQRHSPAQLRVHWYVKMINIYCHGKKIDIAALIWLKNQHWHELVGSDEEQVAVALGYVCHILTLLSKYLEVSKWKLYYLIGS